jgi:PAS domain S-box-containing protein
LFEHSPDGIVIIDPATGRPLEFNETVHRQLGYSREEFARLSISDLEAVETPEETRSHIAKIIREGRDDFETRQRTRQGEIRDILVTAQIIEVLGRPVYHCVWRDITKHKRAEEALKASEIRYRRLFESAKDGILILDAETGIIVDVNPFLIELLGSSQEEFLGKELWELGFLRTSPRARLISWN